MTTLPPPSWQRDPLGRCEYRFWDGTQWSDHVVTGGIEGIDPLPHAPVSGSDPETQQHLSHHPSNRQIAKEGRNQFESLAIKAAHGDTDYADGRSAYVPDEVAREWLAKGRAKESKVKVRQDVRQCAGASGGETAEGLCHNGSAKRQAW
jgi:Protein of unknown function (DUF2510)